MIQQSKGSLGELKTIEYLLKKDYPVFTEFGNRTRVDIVTIIDGKTVKIQCKAKTSKDGKVDLTNETTSTKYTYRYTKQDIDFFAVYVLDKDVLFFVSSEEICDENFKSMTFRIEDPKNHQKTKSRSYKDYVDLII
jgi:hypothetical protein